MSKRNSKIQGYGGLPRGEKPEGQKMSEEQLKSKYGKYWQMYEEREGVNWENVRTVNYFPSKNQQ